MLERRRREEADGESRMMGSGLRFAFLETGPFGVGMRAGVGACFEERERKAAVYFLTWEKSCPIISDHFPATLIGSDATHGWLDPPQHGIPVPHLSLL